MYMIRFYKTCGTIPFCGGENIQLHKHLCKRKSPERCILNCLKHPQYTGISGGFDVCLHALSNISTVTQTLKNS